MASPVLAWRVGGARHQDTSRGEAAPTALAAPGRLDLLHQGREGSCWQGRPGAGDQLTSWGLGLSWLWGGPGGTWLVEWSGSCPQAGCSKVPWVERGEPPAAGHCHEEASPPPPPPLPSPLPPSLRRKVGGKRRREEGRRGGTIVGNNNNVQVPKMQHSSPISITPTF